MKNFSLAAKLKINKFDNDLEKQESHRWFGKDLVNAKSFIYKQAIEIAKSLKPKQSLLFITPNDENSANTINSIQKKNIPLIIAEVDRIKNLNIDAKLIGGIFSLYHDSLNNAKIATSLLSNKKLAKISFEYILLNGQSYKEFEKYDSPLFVPSYFVSPLSNEEKSAFSIYEQSLLLFDQKCQIRIYTEIYQHIKNIVERSVDGDCVEFGSYHGHSGYLISKTLEHLNSKKKLYMYDMFDHFPEQDIGIDKFWGNTHTVNYRQIKTKFKSIKNVKLIKGDFTKTFKSKHPNQIAFAYVDCDSYTSTKFVIKNVFDNYLSTGGVMMFEDYGHPALMGARIAFHEFFDSNKHAFKIFSQFSGAYTVVKMKGGK